MNAATEISHDQQLNTMPYAGTSTSALVLDGQSFQQIMDVAKVMCQGKATVPKQMPFG